MSGYRLYTDELIYTKTETKITSSLFDTNMSPALLFLLGRMSPRHFLSEIVAYCRKNCDIEALIKDFIL